MARKIRERPAESTESAAERRLFEWLRDDSGDDLVAFHHVAWLIPRAKRPEQGEADFVLTHPHRGLLVLEVKGGSIGYDAAGGQWWTRGKSGDAAIKDPFNQARRNSHSLRRLLERGRPGAGVDIRGGSAELSRGRVADAAFCRAAPDLSPIYAPIASGDIAIRKRGRTPPQGS
jgi:hypothetical protein